MAPRPTNPDPSPACHLAFAFLPLLLLPAVAATSYPSLCRAPAAAADQRVRGAGPLRLPPLSTGYFSGGARLLFSSDASLPRSFSFFPRRAVRTEDPALLHLFATVTLSGFRRRDIRRPHSVSFDLEGYYSTASVPAVLCMVGSGSRARDDGLGAVILPDVALRLSLPNPANMSHPFVTGSLEGAGFRAVAVVAYPDGGYTYGHTASCPAPPPPVRGARQMLNGADFSCARLRALLQSSGSYGLEYNAGVGSGHVPGSFSLRQRHRRMYMNQLHCDGEGNVRALIVFYSNQPEHVTSYNHTVPWRLGFFAGDETLVADGFWDSSRSRLCLRACRVRRSPPSSADWVVGECGIGMHFWFPAAWSIRDRSVVAGSIWNTTTKSGDGDDPAKTPAVISVSRTASFMDNVSDITYNYTRVEEAKKHHASSIKAEPRRSSREVPGNFSQYDFAFDFYLKGEAGRGGGHGHASPVAIGSALVDGDQLMADAAFFSRAVPEMSKATLLNISYEMRYYEYQHQITHPDLSWNTSSLLKSERWRISAEGVYDRETGSLCMVACMVNGTSSSDCKVLVKLQFGSLEAAAMGERAAVGSISSLRESTDALFFDAWSIIGYGAAYKVEAEAAIERMDAERVALLLAMALSCVFAALQLRHGRLNPDALPATSVTMLAVMALGCVPPLVLNFEAMFESRRRNFVELAGGGLLELNELALRASTMVAFVLQLRLLQLAWSARSSSEPGNAMHRDWSAAERRAFWVCLTLYLAGGVLIWIFHIGDGRVHGVVSEQVQARGATDVAIVLTSPRPSLPEDLVSYAGLILDGFLLPQIILNAFAGSGSRVRALSPWFYAGGTVVRAVPRAYGALRARGYYAPALSSWAVYESPRDGLFSAAWVDIVVPCVAAALAVLLLLQQRLGGAFLCCLGSRKKAGEYEMVSSTVSS